MQISLHGLRSIIIQRNGSNGQGSLYIDPPAEAKRGVLPNKEIASVLVSHPQDASLAVKNFANVFIVAGPGEYEVKDALVRGVASTDGKILYAIEDEGITLAYLGDTNQTEITDEQLDALGTIDVLFVPVGGQDTLDAKRAMHLVQEIEPRLVIPIMFGSDGYDSVEAFARGFGSAAIRSDKLKLTKKDLPDTDTKLVILENK